MPYKTKGKCVYKKDTGKKVGCTKGSVKKYLAALHMNAESKIDIKNIVKEEIEDFEWIKNTTPYDGEFDVCDLIGLPRDIVGKDIIVTYGGYGPRNSTASHTHHNVPAKVVAITEPWNEEIKVHLEAKEAGWTPSYIRCGWRFKFDS